MAQTYVAATKFTAIDKFSSVVNKMNKTTNSFSGTIAKLGGVIGGLAIGQQIVDANLQAEKSFQSLSAVTGLSGKAFDTFKVAAEQTASATGMLIGDTAKAMELIGSQKPELLASAAAMQQVTEAAITLSRASGEDLAASAGNLTGIMNQFNLGAEMASKSINVLAAGTVAGAASIADVAESLKNVGTVASMSNMSLEDTVATLQALSLKKITGAEAGTKLRGVILKLKEAGIGYKSGQFKMNDALEEAQTKMSKLTGAKAKDAFASKVFGAENINAALVMIDSIKTIKDMTVAVTGSNAANEMAGKNVNTLAMRIDRLKNQFLNMFTATDSNNKLMKALNGTITYLTDNMNSIIKAISIAIGIWGLYKLAIAANIAYQTAYAVVLGISAAANGTLSLAVAGSTLAIAAYSTYVKVAAIAQLIFNSALFAVIWPIMAVIAASITIIAIFKNWGSIMIWFSNIWKGLIVIWNKFTGAIASIEWVNNFKIIGNAIIRFILLPFKAILTIVAALPGKIGELGNAGLDKLNNLQFDVNAPENNNLNPDAAKSGVMTQRFEQIQKQNMTIFVKPVDGASATTSGMKDINAKVSPTLAKPR